MGVTFISHPKFPTLKKHEKFCLFLCHQKPTKQVFLVRLFTEYCGLLRGRSQANCLDIFHLLAETKTIYRSP